MSTDINLVLVPFLRNLATSIETNKLSPEQLQNIGEFFISYELAEKKDSDIKEDFDDMDIIKFLTLGWWIYTHILNREDTES